MVEARDSHTATLLSDGKVLVTGGVDSQGVPIASAEVFDPQSGQWTAVGPLTQALGDHTATLLPNGKVLVAGGDTNTGIALASAALCDPRTATWTWIGNM